MRRDDYLREPPVDSPPAVVGALFATSPGTERMVATLLDLFGRGVVKPEAVRRGLLRDDSRRAVLYAVLFGMAVCFASVLATPLLGVRRDHRFRASGTAVGVWGISSRQSPVA